MKKLSLTLSVAFMVTLFAASCNRVKGQTTSSFEFKKDSLFAHKKQVKRSFFNKAGSSIINFLFKSDPVTLEKANAVYDQIAPDYSLLRIQKIVADLNKRTQQEIVNSYLQLAADYGGGFRFK